MRARPVAAADPFPRPETAVAPPLHGIGRQRADRHHQPCQEPSRQRAVEIRVVEEVRELASAGSRFSCRCCATSSASVEPIAVHPPVFAAGEMPGEQKGDLLLVSRLERNLLTSPGVGIRRSKWKLEVRRGRFEPGDAPCLPKVVEMAPGKPQACSSSTRKCQRAEVGLLIEPARCIAFGRRVGKRDVVDIDVPPAPRLPDRRSRMTPVCPSRSLTSQKSQSRFSLSLPGRRAEDFAVETRLMHVLPG